MRPVIKYETLFWIVYVVLTTLFIVDRMTININPRQDYTTKWYKTASDPIEYRGGPWSVYLFDVVARVSGRYIMVALNALFFTMMHTFHSWLYASRARKLVDFSDETATRRIHIYIGVSIAVLSIVHVWSILFPNIFSRYSLLVVVGWFKFPLSEDKPKWFKDVDVKTETVMMQVDDVYRLIMITIILGPLVYISYRLMATNYRWGIRLHQFVLLMFTIDNLRRHTHPHTWVVNLPFFIAWIVDYVQGLKYRHQKVDVHRHEISPHYLVVYWKNKTDASYHEKIKNSIGAVVKMRGIGEKASVVNQERLHPFTTFGNRGLKLQTMTSQEWDRAIILRVFDKHQSVTRKLREEYPLTDVHMWGPFGGDTKCDIIKSGASTLLVGGGSGSGYLVDTLTCLATIMNDVTVNVRIVFTTRDLALTQFWIDVINEIYDQVKMPRGVHVTISLTSGSQANRTPAELERETEYRWGRVQFIRCDLRSQMALLKKTQNNHKTGHVFCQGSGSLQETASKAAKSNGFTYHPNASFDNAGPVRTDEAKIEEETSSGWGYKPDTVANGIPPLSKARFNAISPIWSTQGYRFKTDCYQGGRTIVTM